MYIISWTTQRYRKKQNKKKTIHCATPKTGQLLFSCYKCRWRCYKTNYKQTKGKETKIIQRPAPAIDYTLGNKFLLHKITHNMWTWLLKWIIVLGLVGCPKFVNDDISRNTTISSNMAQQKSMIMLGQKHLKGSYTWVKPSPLCPIPLQTQTLFWQLYPLHATFLWISKDITLCSCLFVQISTTVYNTDVSVKKLRILKHESLTQQHGGSTQSTFPFCSSMMVLK